MAANGVTLDTVIIDIESNAGNSVDGINNLSHALSDLQQSIKGGFASLNNLSQYVKNLSSGLDELSRISITVDKVTEITDALKPLTSLQAGTGVKNIASGLLKLPSAFEKITPRSLENVERVSKELSAALDPLADKLNKIAQGFSKIEMLANRYGISVTKIRDNTQGTSKQTNAFAKTLDRMSGAINRLTKSVTNFGGVGVKQFGRVWSKIKQVYLSLLGTRTLFTAVRKAVGEYAQMDAELTWQTQNLWRALGAQLAPVVEYCLHLFKQFVRVIYSIILALTGIDLIARANAKAMSSWGKSAKSTLGNLQKFDDLNVVEFSGKEDNNLIQLDPIDLSPIQKVIDWMKKLKEAIKEAWNSGNLSGVFDVLSEGLNSAVQSFLDMDIDTLATKISNLLYDVAEGVWKVISNFPSSEVAEKLHGALLKIEWGDILTKVAASIMAWIGTLSELFFGTLFGVKFKDKGQAAVWGLIALLGVKLLPTLLGLLFGGIGSKITGAGAVGAGFGSMLEDLGKAVQMIAILGGLALVLTAIVDLFKTLHETGTSVSDVINLLLVTFTVFAGLMATVALLGPAMTAGMAPFAVLVLGIMATLITMAATIPIILDACGKFIETIAPPIESILNTIGNLITNIIYALGIVLPPIITAVGSVFRTIFNGISKVIETVGNTITKILNAIASLVERVLGAILNFVNQIGPAINRFVDNTIRAVTKLINFIISGVEFFVNGIIKGINGLSSGLRKVGNKIFEIIGVDITFDPIKTVSLERFAPKLSNGTNEVPYEGLYHLHPGEAVVPKKYNPALGNGTDEEVGQKLDTLIGIMNNLEFTNVVNIGNKTLYKEQQRYNKMQNDKYGTTVNL